MEEEQAKIPVRIIDTQVFLATVKEMVREGRKVPLTVTGNSMTPFLVHGRDKVLLSKIAKPLKKGDIVLYQRKNGQYVLHRIQYIKKAQREYYTIGDAQTLTEGPLKDEQMAAVVTAVCRKGKWLKPGCFWWEFFRRIWIHIVFARRPVVEMYAFVAGKMKGEKL